MYIFVCVSHICIHCYWLCPAYTKVYVHSSFSHSVQCTYSSGVFAKATGLIFLAVVVAVTSVMVGHSRRFRVCTHSILYQNAERISANYVRMSNGAT